MLLNISRPILIRVLLVLSLFGILSTTTFETTPVEAGACVGAPSGNCG